MTARGSLGTLGLWMGLALLLQPGRTFAAPPFETDDPEPVDLGHWEVYLASQLERTADGNVATAPHLEINYGALNNVQLHLIAPMAMYVPQTGASEYGYGDTELGVKFRFLQEGKALPQAGIFPLLELPSGDANRNLGSGTAQACLPLWLQKSWGPWTSYGGGGYWFNPGQGNQNWCFLGWEIQRDLADWLTLGAELFHRSPSTEAGQAPTAFNASGAFDAPGQGTGFNVGGQVNFGAHVHLLLSLGRDFFGGPNQLTDYLAVQWTR